MAEILRYSDSHWTGLWSVLEPVLRAGETYAFAPDITEAEARHVWTKAPLATFVAVQGADVLGTYYVKANQPGLGSHVCNCGYVVGELARGRGLASAMCVHSQTEARRMGFRSMQYNLVASTNRGAIRLWQRHGFEIVGTLTGAFRHVRLGFVDAHVMYKQLTPEE